MSQPNLFNISAFDSTISKIIYFSYFGNQSLKNELVIRNNSTNNIVYQQTQTTFLLQHNIQSHILENGLLYNAQIRVYDADNNPSPWSNIVPFYCFSIPQFNFINIISNQIINNSTFDFQLNYLQGQNEPLNFYRVILYENNIERYNSGNKYNSDLLSVTVNNLEDNTKYQIRATGETLHGIILDTGFIDFSVDYIQPSSFAVVDVTNLYDTAEIRIQCNVKSIIGTSNPSPPLYNNSKVILTEDDAWVEFDEAFSINNDFTLQIEGCNFNNYSTILEMYNSNYKIELIYMLGTFNSDNVSYFLLKVYNRITNYELTSNYISMPAKEDIINIWLRKIGGLYSLFVKNLSGSFTWNYKLDGRWKLGNNPFRSIE